ncbi:hypothetical protein EVA_03341 [gut metagenome]|uniref:Uncharacterized protein n=1 Tax=gut metagenome TaxID=749906 RepID=J9D741_9ZZZZ
MAANAACSSGCARTLSRLRMMAVCPSRLVFRFLW